MEDKVTNLLISGNKTLNPKDLGSFDINFNVEKDKGRFTFAFDLCNN